MKRKMDYFGFVLILILVCFLIGIFILNPHFLNKIEFNKTFENIQSDIEIDTKGQIIDYIEKRIMHLSGDVLRLKQNNRINSTQEEIILSTLDRASNSYSDYKINFKEEDLYQALFYSQASLAYYKSYPFINCASKLSETSRKYSPLFYYLSHSDRERVFSILETSNGLNKYLDYNSKYRNNTVLITQRSREAFRIEQSFDFYELKCEKFNKYLNEDYSRQRLLFIFKVIVLAGLFIFGFILGKGFKIIKKINLEHEAFFKRFSKFFFPEKVKDKTIERVLKTNSILAVFSALGIAFLFTNNFLTQFLGVLAIIDVLVFLSAIIIGISALNNFSERGKRISYSLYSIGIIGFIVITIYFFILFIFGGLFSNVKSSFQTFLNNQTTAK